MIEVAVLALSYDGRTDQMFHLVRQYAAGTTAVLTRILGVLTAVVSCERDTKRVASLRRHADLVLRDGERDIKTPADFNGLRVSHAKIANMSPGGPIRVLLAEGGSC